MTSVITGSVIVNVGVFGTRHQVVVGNAGERRVRLGVQVLASLATMVVAVLRVRTLLEN